MRDEHDRRIELDERLLQPLQRLDVEMVGGLVEQQHVGAGGERPGERGARELTAGERVERTVEVGFAEAEAVGHRGRAVAPQVAAARIQARLGPGVARERGLVAGARPPSSPPARSARPRSRSSSAHPEST